MADSIENSFFIQSNSFVEFQFIVWFYYIILLQYRKEKSRQTLLPGLIRFYEHLPFGRHFYDSQGFMV